MQATSTSDQQINCRHLSISVHICLYLSISVLSHCLAFQASGRYNPASFVSTLWRLNNRSHLKDSTTLTTPPATAISRKTIKCRAEKFSSRLMNCCVCFVAWHGMLECIIATHSWGQHLCTTGCNPCTFLSAKPGR